MKPRIGCFVFSVCLGVFLATGTATVWGDTHYVAHGGQHPGGTFTDWTTAASNIQDAVDVASASGDSVLVSNGVYDAGGTVFDGQTNRVYISAKKIFLQAISTNPADTFIVGGGSIGPDAVRCVYIDAGGASDGIVANFTLTNGHAAEGKNGGGLWTSRNPLVTNCIITGCSTPLTGGGVYSKYSLSVTLNNCTLSGNYAGNGGGAYYCLVTNNCSIIGNTATNDGGGLNSGAAYGSTIAGNVASRNGGGLCAVNAYDCNISNNVAGNCGGGCDGYGGSLTHCVISSNWAANKGGGVQTCSLVTNCTITRNIAAAGDGGGVSDGKLYDTTLIGNIAGGGGSGGGLCPDGQSQGWGLAIRCTFIGNYACYGGGMSYAPFTDCVFSNNWADQRGGATRECDGTNSIFYYNFTTNTAFGYGGAMYRGSAWNCTFIGNTGCYGGAHGYEGELFNCLFVGNYASHVGGAMYGCTNAVNCTVVSNTVQNANTGGGINGSTAKNCIVWGNHQSSDGAINNYSADAVMTYSCSSPLPGGLGNTAADPQFVDFAGGNYRLGFGTSPCINAGTNQAWMTTWPYDRDGKIRIRYGTVDMGCYERIYSGTIYGFR